MSSTRSASIAFMKRKEVIITAALVLIVIAIAVAWIVFQSYVDAANAREEWIVQCATNMVTKNDKLDPMRALLLCEEAFDG